MVLSHPDKNSMPGKANDVARGARSQELLASGPRRFVRGIGASTIMLGLSYLSNFLLVPIILHAWGPTGYGLWVTLFAAVSYLALLDLGGQTYVQNILATSYAREDHAEFRRALSQGVATYLWLGAGCFALWSIVVAWAWFWPPPLLGRTLSTTELVVLLILAANQFLISIPFGIFGTSYRATGRFTRAAMLGNVNKIMLFGLSVAVLLGAGGPELLAAAYLAVGAISLVILWLDSRRFLPDAWPLDLSWKTARSGFAALKGSFFNWLVTLSNMVNQQTPLLILAKFAPTHLVALFATHRMIANLAAYAPGIVTGPILPELSYLWSLGKFEAFRRLIVRAVAVMILATGLVALVVFFLAPFFFVRWTAGHVPLDAWLLAACLLQGVTNSATTAASWALIATNRHRLYSLSCVFQSLVFVVTAALVVPRWGPLGLIAAMVVLDVVFLGLALPALVARVLPGAARALLRASALSFAALAVVAGILAGVSRWLPSVWVLPLALAVITAFGVALLMTLNHRWSGATEASAARMAPSS